MDSSALQFSDLDPEGFLKALTTLLPPGITAKRGQGGKAIIIRRRFRNSAGCDNAKQFAATSARDVITTVERLCRISDAPHLAWESHLQESAHALLMSDAASMFELRVDAQGDGVITYAELNRLLPKHIGMVITHQGDHAKVMIVARPPKPAGCGDETRQSLSRTIYGWSDIVPVVTEFWHTLCRDMPGAAIEWEEQDRVALLHLCHIDHGGLELPFSDGHIQQRRTSLLTSWVPPGVTSWLSDKPDGSTMLTLKATTPHPSIATKSLYSAIHVHNAQAIQIKLDELIHGHNVKVAELAGGIASMDFLLDGPRTDIATEAVVNELVALGLRNEPLSDIERLCAALPEDVYARVWTRMVGGRRRANVRLRLHERFTRTNSKGQRSAVVYRYQDLLQVLDKLSNRGTYLSEGKRAFLADVSRGTIILNLPW